MAQSGVESLLQSLRAKDDEISRLMQHIQKLHDELVSAHSSLGAYADELYGVVTEISCLKASLATRFFLNTRP